MTTSNVNRHSRRQVELQSKVLIALEMRPQSYRELETTLEEPYSSIRLAVETLRETEQVIPSTKGYRNLKFQLNLNGVNKPSTMGRLIAQGIPRSYFEFMLLRKQVNFKAAVAAQNFPMHITRIMHQARTVSTQGEASVSSAAIKRGMIQDLEALQTLVQMYETVIMDQRNWTNDALKQYVNDPTWDNNEFLDAYNHYFAPSGQKEK